MFFLNLESANPLVGQHHFICYLVDHLCTRDIYRTRVNRRISEVNVGCPFPNFDVLIARASGYSASVVVKLNIVNEIIVS